jgi:hypothetical protein
MAEESICCSNSFELSPDEERIMIRDIAISSQANTKEGDTFFIITQRFFLFLFILLLIIIIFFSTGYLNPKFEPFLFFG